MQTRPPVNIALSADGASLFVSIGLCFGNAQCTGMVTQVVIRGD